MRELCTIKLQFFSQFVVAPTDVHHQCYRSEIFPNTIMLLKVDRFEGFSNWSNIDKLVIIRLWYALYALMFWR